MNGTGISRWRKEMNKNIKREREREKNKKKKRETKRGKTSPRERDVRITRFDRLNK